MYKHEYEILWKEIIENPDGSLNREKIMQELYDYMNLLENTQQVFYAVTQGRVSNPHTLAREVIRIYEDCLEQMIEEELNDRKA